MYNFIGEHMVPSQLEKLKKDSRELEHFIARMKKQGRIDSYIQSVTEEKYSIY
jgi:hypothetical protein